MASDLKKRLAALESLKPADKDKPDAGEVDLLALFEKITGFPYDQLPPIPGESMAEATARALGMTGKEFKAWVDTGATPERWDHEADQ